MRIFSIQLFAILSLLGTFSFAQSSKKELMEKEQMPSVQAIPEPKNEKNPAPLDSITSDDSLFRVIRKLEVEIADKERTLAVTRSRIERTQSQIAEQKESAEGTPENLTKYEAALARLEDRAKSLQTEIAEKKTLLEATKKQWEEEKDQDGP